MSVQHRLARLHESGQSVWLDFISRGLISSGELRRMIAQDGLRGMTSNPTIFERAIVGSSDYDRQMQDLAVSGMTSAEIFDQSSATDVRLAADELRGVFDDEVGADGYVSIEVGPWMAADTEATVAEAHRLSALVDRPNVMVKIPATAAGIPAIARCLAEGMNINITLMFSMADYEAVSGAYLRALEERLKRGEPIDAIASVASFFVSRVDTLVDKTIDEKLRTGLPPELRERLESLRGRLAVANAKLVYERFREVFSGERWRRLSENGARIQRVLWASTSTKNPAYSDTKYVDELIGPDTVSTMTQETMAAFNDHGTVRRTVDEDVAEAHRLFREAAEAGIDMGAVTRQLQVEGVAAFETSYESLLGSLDLRRRHLLGEAA